MTRADLPDEALVFDPADLDVALIGVTLGQPGRTPVAVYDYDRLVAAFIDTGMEYEDAVEWIDFNVLGAWLGEATPLVMLAGSAGSTR